MRRLLVALLAWGAVQALAAPAADFSRIPRLDFEIVGRYPSNPRLFTQGLVFRDGRVYQSGGGYQRSRIEIRTLREPRALVSRDLPGRWFAEGIALCAQQLFMVTWQEQTAAVFEPDSLAEKRLLNYAGEGWGLTCHRNRLLMSNGSPLLVWRDVNDFRIVASLAVTANGAPVRHLNELEWINGKIYANIWRTPFIAQIDPADGKVVAVLELANLLTPEQRRDADVLNGIAWDAETESLLVTGKLWPIIFALKVPAI